jgi:radical SAM superfamily enzyme YgiQ (UPF0313 family)
MKVTFVETRNTAALRSCIDPVEEDFFQKLLKHLEGIGYYPKDFDVNAYSDQYLFRTGGWVQALSSHLLDIETELMWYTGEEKLNGRLESDVYLVSLTESVGYPVAKKFIREVRKFRPSARVVVGGLHATIAPEETAIDLQPDLLFVGEADAHIRSIVGSVQRGAVRFFSNVMEVANAGEMRDSWDMFMQNSAPLARRTPYLLTSRDCPYHCRFCSIVKKGTLRSVDTDTLRQGIASLNAGADIKLYIESPLPFYNKTETARLAGILKESKLEWYCDFRVMAPTHDSQALFDMLYSAGCRHIYFGTETFDQTVSDLLNKKINVEHIVKLARQAKNSGIHVHTGWIVGFPGQTMESARRDIDLVVKNLAEGTFDVAEYKYLTIYPGTAFSLEPERFGITFHSRSFDDLENVPHHSTSLLSNGKIWDLYLEGLQKIAAEQFRGQA